VDLIKAFDMVQHKQMCQILQKYGLPLPIVKNIEKLYKKCKVKITTGKESTFIDYTTGVHQGDNMSPVLFFIHHPGLSCHPSNRRTTC
jgi:hypothetical protein